MAPNQEITERRTPRLHLDFIDGLRGLAALYVLMHHVWQYSITGSATSPPGWFRVATIFKYGSYAVAVFIVVSGYCLMLPVLRNGGFGNRGGFGGFAWRRSRRILPPYFAVLAASMVLILLDPDLRRASGTPWDITLPSFTVGKVVSHLPLVHNWSEAWQYGFDPPLWSIALEFQIYFVFALLLLPIWRRHGLAVVIAAAFGLAVIPWAFGLGFASPWMLGLFAMGMAAATVGTREGREAIGSQLPWRKIALGAVIAVPVVTFATSPIHAAHLDLMIPHVTVGLATMAGLVYMTDDQLTGHRWGGVQRALATDRLRRVGLFSYSLYLVHYPIVAVVTLNLLAGHDLSAPLMFVALTAICVPLSLLVAYFFHRAVERRFLNAPLASSATTA